MTRSLPAKPAQSTQPPPPPPLAQAPRSAGSQSLGSVRESGSAGADDEFVADDLEILRLAPPWMVSLIIHMVLLIILALVVIPATRQSHLEIQAIFADSLGDQLDEEPLMLVDDPMESIEEQILAEQTLPEVLDELASPPLVVETPVDPLRSSSELESPAIGMALRGREASLKSALLGAYGGTQTTERAVGDALQWLRRNQRSNGSWSLQRPYSDGANAENKLAATSMALLAFQGAGHTHQSGQFQREVARGWNWMRQQQDARGNYWKGGSHNHRLYSQAQATIGICELFGMSRDESFREPAQRAVDYAVSIQAHEGGWRYAPSSGSDTSVTGWFVMALQSAMMAGLEVPSPALERITEYLDGVESPDGRYKYRRGRSPTVVMTAEALLCRQYLGWPQDEPRLVAGAEYLLEHPIKWSQQNVYYWYYATQVLHHMEGPSWTAWNQVMREVIPSHQEREGKEAGSWSPNSDRWGLYGGRLYTTCLCVYMLEVYYRHLPIYSPLYGHE